MKLAEQQRERFPYRDSLGLVVAIVIIVVNVIIIVIIIIIIMVFVRNSSPLAVLLLLS